jgi:ABC-type Fe3+/spermidine/putrescine transport system ATPase subunit
VSSEEALLSVRGLGVRWGPLDVLRGIDLDVFPGEFVGLLGRNGSGKTTLLRTIAGFERPTAGTIRFAGRELGGVPVHARRIGILFQEPALFPGRTVWENVAYGLELAGRPRAEVERRVGELLRLLHLAGLEGRRGEALSGGERQRVALARTLAPGPSLVLLDEPFASVDPERRGELRAVFRSALRRLGVAAIHVTHDREEGIFLADRVALLDEGRLLRTGSPQEVLEAPGSVAAARFLGYNILEEGGRRFAVDPRAIELGPAGEGLPAEIEVSGPTPGGPIAYARLSSGERWEVRLMGEGPAPRPGTTVGLRVRRRVSLER